MTDRFYDICLDHTLVDQWHLSAPVDDNGVELLGTVPKNGLLWDTSKKVHGRIYSCGLDVDFSLGGRATYFVRTWVMDLLRSIVPPDRLQGIPVEIEGVDNYEILNSLDIVDCLDESRSDLSWWTQEDGLPERVGTYDVNALKVDPLRATGHDLFRVKTWPIALVCSERIRDLLIANGVTGIRFTLVS